MKQGKEVRSKEVANRDPEITGFSYDEFFNNRLSLSDEIKKYLNEQGLDWRFINAGQFRSEGNQHRSHWVPHKFEGKDYGVLNADGYICRGDLILATRPKKVSRAHRAFLDERNARLKGYNRSQAQELRKSMREAGIDTKISEGYGDDE